MESIVGIIIGLAIGAGGGAAMAWLAMKARGGGASAELRQERDDAKLESVRIRTEFEASQQRYEDLEGASAELREEALSARQAAEASRVQSAELQANLDAAAKRAADLESANAALTGDAAHMREQASQAAAANASLQANLDAANKRLSEQTDIEKTLLAQFKAMAADALSQNSGEFIKAADEKIKTLVEGANKDFSVSKEAVEKLVKPLSDELKRIENSRTEAQATLTQQIEALAKNNANLADETRSLSTALKRPEVRGSWGEMQLRRVVELAGMIERCDFDEQVSAVNESGGRDRPDMIVRMPNERTIVVDAKTPMDAYLTAVESETDQDRADALQRHAQQVKERARNLAQTSYLSTFDKSPDFVVMFLPGEYLLSAALENDRDLIDWAMERKVVIATPNTLMALLKAVSLGWQEARMAQEAANVARIGQELHDRLSTFAGHMARMGGSLESAVKHYNSGVGSLERNVMTSARRFKDMGVSSSREIQELAEIETAPRELRSAGRAALPPAQDAAAGD